MRKWYDEEYSFKITVVSTGSDNGARHCRNGHEPGDTYTCQYGCPGGTGGFCSKSMLKLFPLLEAIRAEGDLSNILAGAEKHRGEFACPDGVVTFRLEAFKKIGLKPEPVDESFRQAVTEFISERWHGTRMLIRGQVIDMTKVDGFVVFNKGAIIGLITYLIEDRICEVTSFDSLLPGSGIGTMLMERVINTAKQKSCTRIQLITTNDNVNAIRFYQKHGFELVGIYLGAIDLERVKKPQIPLIGQNGIPLRHEVDFAMELK